MPKPHIHIHTSSRDCDGPMERFRTINEIPRPSYYRELEDGEEDDYVQNKTDMWLWAISTLPDLYQHEQTVTLTVDNQAFNMSWGGATEEGYAGGEVQYCEDDECSDEHASQRDHFAEAMGY